MGQPDWAIINVQQLQELRQPSARPKIREHAFRDQHRAERDWNDEQGCDPALIARLAPQLERDRQREADVQDRDGQ